MFFRNLSNCYLQTKISKKPKTKQSIDSQIPQSVREEDTSFNIGPNNVACDVKVDSDELPLQEKKDANICKIKQTAY